MAVRLIVNADDFGISDSANRAIERAHREGILTSASLMVAGDAAAAAVQIARNNPRLGVGLHSVLVCGRSVLPPKEIPRNRSVLACDCAGSIFTRLKESTAFSDLISDFLKGSKNGSPNNE